MQVTGAPAQQAFKQLLVQLFQLNESPNFYSLAKPALNNGSGWEFGILQFDVLNNKLAYNSLASVLLQAKDASGNFIVEPGKTTGRAVTDQPVQDLQLHKTPQPPSHSFR
jgi:hypothetical protein